MVPLQGGQTTVTVQDMPQFLDTSGSFRPLAREQRASYNPHQPPMAGRSGAARNRCRAV